MAQKVNHRAASLWFTGIAFSLLSSVYRLVDLNRREQQARRVRSSEKEPERRAELKQVLQSVLPRLSSSFCASATRAMRERWLMRDGGAG